MQCWFLNISILITLLIQTHRMEVTSSDYLLEQTHDLIYQWTSLEYIYIYIYVDEGCFKN